MGTEYKSKKELDEEDWERYRKKQNDIFERKKAKFEAEGFKCMTEGCTKSFKDFNEWQIHVTKHQDDLKKAMICNQPKCGKKFDNRKAYNEHCEIHKKEMKARIVNSIRAVLMYNKHGLLFEVFEQEYRGMVGKPIPHKFFGCSSLYDLFVSWPEVVEMTLLGGGQVLLIGVPDKKTEHIAKMVGNQRDTREGFNRRNGQMLASVGIDVIHKIDKISGRKSRKIPEFLQRQVEQLLEMELFESGLYLYEFQQVYEQEFGYPLDYRSYGFYSLEDFCFHGLQDSAAMELAGLSWRLLPPGVLDTGIGGQMADIPREVKINIKKLMYQNPFGMSEISFLRNYESCFGQLNLRQLMCGDLLELLLLLPECCVAARGAGGQVTVLPAGWVGERQDTDTVHILGEFKNNMLHLLHAHPAGVSVDNFVKGYEGYYGYLPLHKLGCRDVLELCRSVGDVCEVRLGESGQYVIVPADRRKVQNLVNNSEDLRTVATGDKDDVIKVLWRHPDGVKASRFPIVFLETVGGNIIPGKLGFSSLISIFRHLSDSVDVLGDDEELHVWLGREKVGLREPDAGNRISKMRLLPGCWVTVLGMSDSRLLCLQMVDDKNELEEMEMMMQQCYWSEDTEEKVDPCNLVVGLPVAALYKDLAWHRGEVVEVKQEKLLIQYVDWGWRGLVRCDSVRRLDERFASLPCSSVVVRCEGMETVMETWGEAVRHGSGKGRLVMEEEGHLYMDIYIKASNREIGLIKDIKTVTKPSSSISLNQNLSQMVVRSLDRVRQKERGGYL